MAGYDKGKAPILPDRHSSLSNDNADSQLHGFLSRTQTVSISIPMNSMESYKAQTNHVAYTGPSGSERKPLSVQMSGLSCINENVKNLSLPKHSVTSCKRLEEKFPSIHGIDQNDCIEDKYGAKNEHLLRSGTSLGMCDEPYCTTCPPNFDFETLKQRHGKNSVINPHSKHARQWNSVFFIFCLVAVFLDPLFFVLLLVEKDNYCAGIDWQMAIIFVVIRCMIDFNYLLNIMIQFRLTYVAPESRVPGVLELVEDSKKIAKQYLQRGFLMDIFVVLPLPEVVILLVGLQFIESSVANYPTNVLCTLVLVQYGARCFKFLLLLMGQSPNGFPSPTVWASIYRIIFTSLLFSLIVGSSWYLFGLQRISQCLHDACLNSDIKYECMRFLDCGHKDTITEFRSNSNWDMWKIYANASGCFTVSGFNYGIYSQVVKLTEKHIMTRYIYSLFWGFQQISTLAGNQIPNYYVGEVLFTMAIIELGLVVFTLLIGNMQYFLQGLDRRKFEMCLELHDIERWMKHRRWPKDLRRRVVEAERCNWATTKGIKEETFLERLPEDLQRDIRRHRFKLLKRVRIFALMDDHVIDAICRRIKHNIYTRGSIILGSGGLIEKIVFILHGNLESIQDDGTVIALSKMDVFGEELLTWCLENSSLTKDGTKATFTGQLFSSKTVICLTNVEAFSLSATDLEDVTNRFARFFRNPHVQRAMRYESPCWRNIAATRIQVAWRCRQKLLKHRQISHSNVFTSLSNHSSNHKV